MHAVAPQPAAGSPTGPPGTGRHADPDQPDSTTAVLAHGMLGSMAVIGWGVDTLTRWAEGPDAATIRSVADLVRGQIDLVTGLLGELARGLPPGAVEYLDHQPPP